MSEENACLAIGNVEFPSECGACDPESCNKKSTPTTKDKKKNEEKKKEETKLTCGCPKRCTANALDENANGFSCKNRIQWLMEEQGDTELVACSQIGGMEFRTECASCDPDRCIPETNAVKQDEDGDCPPCDRDTCRSTLNRCPVYTAPYLCYNGPNRGGCSPLPWKLNDHNYGICFKCCKIYPHCDV